jgi:hypothetical protein
MQAVAESRVAPQRTRFSRFLLEVLKIYPGTSSATTPKFLEERHLTARASNINLIFNIIIYHIKSLIDF